MGGTFLLFCSLYLSISSPIFNCLYYFKAFHYYLFSLELRCQRGRVSADEEVDVMVTRVKVKPSEKKKGEDTGVLVSHTVYSVRSRSLIVNKLNLDIYYIEFTIRLFYEPSRKAGSEPSSIRLCGML